jgi:hypothetical protein
MIGNEHLGSAMVPLAWPEHGFVKLSPENAGKTLLNPFDGIKRSVEFGLPGSFALTGVGGGALRRQDPDWRTLVSFR